jgi:putative oxidoreductase
LAPAASPESGIPFPDLMGPFVGVVELICGALIVIGLFTRLAAIPLIVIMIVALVSEARADLTMLLGALYLLIEGGGAWSLDAMLARRSVISGED